MHPKTDDLSQNVISIFLDVTSLASLVAAMRINRVEEQLQYWLHWTVFDPIGLAVDSPIDLRTRVEIANLSHDAQYLGIELAQHQWRPCPHMAHAAIDWAFEHSHVFGRTAFVSLAKAYWANAIDIRQPEAVVAHIRDAGVPTQGLAKHLRLRSTMQTQLQNLVQTRAAHIGDAPVLKVGSTLLPGLLDEEAYVEIIESMG